MIAVVIVVAVVLAVLVGARRGRVAQRVAPSSPAGSSSVRERRSGPGRLPGSRGSM